MIAYFFMFFFIVSMIISMLLNVNGKPQLIYALNLLVIFPLFFYFGLRDIYSGTDTLSYFEYFNQVCSGGVPEFSFEIGFNYLTNFFCGFKSAHFYVFMLTGLQFVFYVLASFFARNKNHSFMLLLFISFIPGLDLLTNGTRNGLALSLGLFFLILNIFNKQKIKYLLQLLPGVLHSSYILNGGLLFFYLLLKRRVNITTICKSLFASSLFFSFFWVFFTSSFDLSFFSVYSSDDGLLGKLTRYVLLDNEIFSNYLKLYFLSISLCLSGYCLFFVSRFDDLAPMSFIVFCLQFLYSALYFSAYSYRFMYLAYPMQIFFISYVLARINVSRVHLIFLLSFIVGNMLITFNTKVFLGVNFSSFF